MSLYQGYAQQKGFDPVHIPDPSGKIRKRGLEQLRWMQEEVEWKEKQSDRFVNALEKNNEYERAQRQQNYEDATHYADIVAKQKWRNFETAINSAKANQKNKEQGFKELLQFTKLGAQAYKAWDTKNKEAIDNFADDISRDYGIGLEAYSAIRDQEDLIKNDNNYNYYLCTEDYDDEVTLIGVYKNWIMPYENIMSKFTYYKVAKYL